MAVYSCVDETPGQSPMIILGADGSNRLTAVEAVVLARGLLQAVERVHELEDMRVVLEQQEARQRATDRGRGAGWGM